MKGTQTSSAQIYDKYPQDNSRERTTMIPDPSKARSLPNNMSLVDMMLRGYLDI